MFVGVSWLAVHMHALPADVRNAVGALADRARRLPVGLLGAGFMYWVVQVLTLAVLVLAANTSYQGFPRLAALLARDRFFARQFTNLGDRLVFSNGIIVLAGDRVARCSSVYNASVDSLIHLYVIGVFTAFTLSQAGMVRYWLRTHDPGWRHRALLNGVGASATGLVTLIVIWTKFAEGAWLVIVAIPLLRARASSGSTATTGASRAGSSAGVGAVRAAGAPTNEVLLWVESLDVATEGALWYARQIAGGATVRALLAPGRHTDPAIRPRWFDFAPDGPKLEMLADRRGARRRRCSRRCGGCRAASRTSSRWSSRSSSSDRSLLSATARTSFRLKLRLLSEPGVVVTDVPVVSRPPRPEGLTPSRLAVRVLLADVHAGSLRALELRAVARDRGHAGGLVRVRRARRPGGSRSAGSKPAWRCRSI